MNKHVLYISYDGMTDPLGQSQVLPYLAGLSKDGYEFTLLSCEKPDKYEKYKATIQAICDANGIHWIPLFYTKKPPVLSTVFDVMKLTRKAKDIYKRKPYQMVHARGAYMTSLVAMSLKKAFGVRYIFDMRGFWADERVDGNIWKLSNPLFKTIFNFFKGKEKEFLENADYVITLTYTAEKEIHGWKNIIGNPLPIQVIPCCVDMDKFSQHKVDFSLQSRLKQELGLKEDDYVLSYLGSLGTWYLLGEMLDFFKVLLSKKPHAKLLFVTNDPEEGIMAAVDKRSIDRKAVLIAHSPFTLVPTYISLSQASLFFIKPAYSKKGSSPIKQGELMSMGIPVVCNANVGDTDWIVSKYQSGVVVHSFETDSYMKAAEELLNGNFDKRSIIGGAKEYFSLEVGVEKYLEVYRKVLK